MDTCPTVTVKGWLEGHPSVVVINEEDFDSKVHKKATAAEIEAANKPAGEGEGEAA